GSDGRSINGSDGRSINGSDGRSINGSDGRSINGSDGRSINGSDGRSINGSDGRLLLVGQVNYVGEDFVSVLGQTVFMDRAIVRGIRIGASVAVYGSIDIDTGSIAGASVLARSSVGGVSYLTGVVDSVDTVKGTAVVSGMNVDYTSLLSTGSAPGVGDMVAVTGREYKGAGLLVADPQLRVELR
ncbi:MAG: hypothetical protein ACR2Q3_04165, partial [Woeseiaceae bacterium]